MTPDPLEGMAVNDDPQLSLAVRAAAAALSAALVRVRAGGVPDAELSQAFIDGMVAGGLRVGSLAEWDRALGMVAGIVALHDGAPE